MESRSYTYPKLRKQRSIATKFKRYRINNSKHHITGSYTSYQSNRNRPLVTPQSRFLSHDRRRALARYQSTEDLASRRRIPPSIPKVACISALSLSHSLPSSTGQIIVLRSSSRRRPSTIHTLQSARSRIIAIRKLTSVIGIGKGNLITRSSCDSDIALC